MNVLLRVFTAGSPALPPAAIETLAELVRGGRTLFEALEALPLGGLPRRARRELTGTLQAARAGEPLEPGLRRLGLEATLGTPRGGATQAAALEADAQARVEHLEALRSVAWRVGPLVLGCASSLTLSLLFAFVVVPAQIESLRASLPAGAPLPPILAGFPAFRARWLAGVGLTAGVLLGVPLAYALCFGWGELRSTLHGWRRRLPLARAHAERSARARLFGALAREAEVGIPLQVTLERVARSTRLPGLRRELERVRRRALAGDPLPCAVRGTFLDSPEFAALHRATAQGARPLAAWRRTAARERTSALTALRRLVLLATLMTLTPVALLGAQLFQAVVVTTSSAELNRLNAEMDAISREFGGVVDAR